MALLSLTDSSAQQDPHYTQYMYNQSVINPAYAGSREGLSLGLLHREQWSGLEGAPKTTTFFGNGRVGKNVGLGLSVISDKIGPVTENNVYADFSYTIKLQPGHKLALGLKAGMTMQQSDFFSEIYYYVPDPNDPAFAENTSQSFFNVGAGVEKNNRKFGSDVMHMFLTGGYVFDLNEDWKLKPSAMLKMAAGAPLSTDVSLNTMYANKLEFGLTYRLDDSMGAMINYAVLPNLRIGYAYDHVTSDLKTAATSSHEIILLFDVFFKKRVSSSPRYF